MKFRQSYNQANAAISPLSGGGGGDPGRSAGALPCAFAGVCSASLLACFYLTMARNTQQSETPMKVCP